MNRFRFPCVFLSLSLLFFFHLPSARADSEVELLRKEVRELKKTVDQLSSVVQQQNNRIEEISGNRASSSKPLETKTPGDFPTEPKNVETAGPAKKPAPEAVPAVAAAPNSTSEVDSLLNTVNNAPPVPGSQSRTVGLWKYPTGSSPAAKLLPDISVIGTFAGAYFTKDPTGDVGVDPNRT
ncbi:MAG: hypothetical protein K8R69_11590, partial [Deltaproteobacteria bacterium]|nr:hypothetical protein [Deltaproteobacteria bacterium]